LKNIRAQFTAIKFLVLHWRGRNDGQDNRNTSNERDPIH